MAYPLLSYLIAHLHQKVLAMPGTTPTHMYSRGKLQWDVHQAELEYGWSQSSGRSQREQNRTLRHLMDTIRKEIVTLIECSGQGCPLSRPLRGLPDSGAENPQGHPMLKIGNDIALVPCGVSSEPVSVDAFCKTLTIGQMRALRMYVPQIQSTYAQNYTLIHLVDD